MTDAHTPTPWDHVESTEHHGAYITSEHGTTICDFYAMSDPSSLSVRNGGTSKPMPFTNADENAQFTVRAVNAHASLVEALTLAREFVQLNLNELIDSCCEWDGLNNQPDRSTADTEDEAVIARVEAALTKIDAALGLARGGTGS